MSFNNNNNNKKLKKQPESGSTSSSSDTTSLPGFYYDPKKKRYFKIQSNNFGQTSVPTFESIQKQEKCSQLETTIQKQIKQRESTLFEYLFRHQIYGRDHQQSRTYDELMLKYSKLYNLGQQYEQTGIQQLISKIRKINVFKSADENHSYLMTTGIEYGIWNIQYEIPYLVQILKFDKSTTDGGLKIRRTRFVFESQSQSEIILMSYLTSIVEKSQHFVTLTKNNSTLTDSYELRIRKYHFDSNNLDEILLDGEDFYVKKYTFLPWCLAIDSTSTRTLVGSPNSALLNSVVDSFSAKLNTNGSDCFCVGFNPNDYNSVFLGCRNRSLFSYDLRESTKRFKIQLHHKSCVNDLKINSYNPNYLFSNDFTGEVSVVCFSVSLWDLRNAKERVCYYFDNVESNQRCSIKLDDSCKYLYQIPKDGHVRIYNVQSSKLIRTILARNTNETYDELPDISLFDKLEFFYALDDKILHFKC